MYQTEWEAEQHRRDESNRRRIFSLATAVREMRKTVRAAKRHARTNAADKIRLEFRTAMQSMIVDALQLHAAGKMDDRYLMSVARSTKESMETSISCSYNKRRPCNALKGFGNFDLLDAACKPVNDSARKIIEAGERGLFDRLLGKNNPYAVPGQKTRRTPKQGVSNAA